MMKKSFFDQKSRSSIFSNHGSIVATMSSIFLKKAQTRIGQLCSKCAMQVTCIKVGYNFFKVLPAKDMYRAASVKSNKKFSRLVPSFHNTSSTGCRIILLSTLLLRSTGKHPIRNASFGVSELPTSTLVYFCLSISASSPINNTSLSRSNFPISSFFGALIEQRLHGLQFQKVMVFPLQQTEIL